MTACVYLIKKKRVGKCVKFLYFVLFAHFSSSITTSSSSSSSSCFFPSCVPLPHLQWLCYQGSQAKGWSNHNFSAGLGRNNEVTKLQLPWQRHIQEHRMPLLKKIHETGPRIFPLRLCFFFFYFSQPSLSPFLCLHHPLPISASPSSSSSRSVFLFFVFCDGGIRSRGEQFTFAPSAFPASFVSEHIQNNKFAVGAFASFWYSCLVGGLFPHTLTRLFQLYEAH